MENDWLEAHMILKVKSGSQAYGTNLESSDTDIKGICIPPIAYHLGFSRFDSYQSGNNLKRNTSVDLDETIYSLNHFSQMAMASKPNVIEMLFGRDEDILEINAYGAVLRENREWFLSKQIKNSFGGFALQQRKRVEMNRNQNPELVELYGYDTKNVMHALRLYEMAIQCFETGTFETYRPNGEWLKSVRLGAYTKAEALELLDEKEKSFIRSFELSDIPKEPDVKKIEELVINLTKEALIESDKNGFLMGNKNGK